jgi:hypothetical protein
VVELSPWRALGLSVLLLSGCQSDEGGGADAGATQSPCKQARSALCEQACACGVDVSCVYFPANRTERSPLRTRAEDQQGCDLLGHLQCDQHAVSGPERDWSQCERDLVGAVCEGLGEARGTVIPPSCELSGDADDPLDDLGLDEPDLDAHEDSPCFTARSRVCDRACECGGDTCTWYAPTRASSQDLQACNILMDGTCGGLGDRAMDFDWAQCEADLMVAQCVEGPPSGLDLPDSCRLPPFETPSE